MEKEIPNYTTDVAVIELKFEEKTPEEILSTIATELYKDPHRRRFFGRFSGVLKSEPILSSPGSSQEQTDVSPQEGFLVPDDRKSFL